MKKKFLFIVFCLSGVLFIIFVNSFIVVSTKPFIFNTLQNIPDTRVGIVLGAKVNASGIPSDILKDRLDGSINAYKIGKIQKILVSGDNGKVEYDEPTAMKNYLVGKGVVESDIFLDYAGFDTYDSFYRAKEIFGVKSLVVFTQCFHQPRSIFIARSLGIDAKGVCTDYHTYLSETKNNLRESLARVKAWFDVKVWYSKPKFLGEKVIISSLN